MKKAPTDVTAVLQSCRALAGVTAETLALVAERCTRRTFSTGDVLIRQGDAGDALLVLVKGRASAAVLDGEGTRHAIGEFEASDVLGEMALLTGEPRTADVVAKADGEALVLSTRDFQDLVARTPELGVVITNLVATRLGDSSADGLGGKQVGEYRIRRCIGRGAMAIVYEAEELAGKRTVALKMLSHRMIYEHGAMARFQREAQILSGLSHPNITGTFGRFQAYKTWFIAMEFCDGADLSVLVRNGYKPGDADVRALIGQLAAGLSYLHQRDIVHRDLKPQNVLITRTGICRLADFGLARLDSVQPQDVLTMPGTVIGTPYYMAPEQMEGKPVTPASDIYALGCVLLNLLTGTTPFKGHSLVEIAVLKRRPKLPPRRRLGRTWLWGGISRPVYQLLEQCLRPRPADRTVDLEALAEWSAAVEIAGQYFKPEAPSPGARV